MANECLAKGDYVIHARNLVDVFMRIPVLYDDECEAESNILRKKKVTDEIGDRAFNLYPNPNNGIMTLDYDLVTDSESNHETI